MTWDLRHGRWQEVLAGVDRVDAVICDPPYSERVHAGQRSGACHTALNTLDYAALNTLDYAALNTLDVTELTSRFNPRWWVIFCDHASAELWRAALASRDLYVFGPVRWVKPDPAPRVAGDGPTCSTEDIVVARKRSSDSGKWGSLRGHYIHGVAELRGGGVAGAKPLPLMREVVRDYTRPGYRVVDPYAGSGTTLVAAHESGCHAIGAEMDAGRYAIARKRLEAYDAQPQLPGMIAHTRATQATLDLSPNLTGDNK